MSETVTDQGQAHGLMSAAYCGATDSVNQATLARELVSDPKIVDELNEAIAHAGKAVQHLDSALARQAGYRPVTELLDEAHAIIEAHDYPYPELLPVELQPAWDMFAHAHGGDVTRFRDVLKSAVDYMTPKPLDS